MKQVQIFSLLVEASSVSCTRERLAQIHSQLSNAAICSGDVSDELAPLQAVAEQLFSDTVDKRREHLPSLFPVFALLCGEKDGDCIFSSIDWTLLSH